MVFQQLRTQEWNKEQTQQFQAPGTRTEPVKGSKIASALKKKPLKTPRNQGSDVFLKMQLVLLMTNPLLLLFPREHLYTQQNTELGLLHREW